ncbi:Fc.00g008520.m01.CDS01 [Cosmosporella sp. VM-42]
MPPYIADDLNDVDFFTTMHDSRTGDRTPVHYTMMTAPRQSPSVGVTQSHSHSHSLSQSLRPTAKQTKSSTPVTSRMPYSVGQNHPPAKLSPRVPDARAPSPNYFGLIVESGNSDPRESSGLPRDTWSPTSSSVKSFQAAIPKQVPLDANPEFEAFKRQADLNRGASFALSSSHYAPATPSMSPMRPRAPPRWHTHSSETGAEFPTGRSLSNVKDRPSTRIEIDQESNHDSAYVSSDSKRNSESSLYPMQITNLPRFDSPRPMDSSQLRNSLTRAEDRDPRLSMMEHKIDPPSPGPNNLQRAATVPPKGEIGQPAMITGAQLRDMLKNANKGRMLLLDIRSSQNYANSRIEGALNLCIPTTLLKRATFNIKKLQQTFQNGPDSEKFSKWREMEYITVYDAHSSDKRDAVTAQNMIKKFTNEGFTGTTCILRGGFNSFQESFSSCVDHRSTAEIAGKFGGTGPGGIAPVIGGVCLPTTGNGSNPFFSNIRQNMDLRDGVGQFDVARPPALDSPSLPTWLRDAASTVDHGKNVSEKFLRIEVEEQSRMRAAYAAFNPSTKEKCPVQLCGVEKGGKNRYKDILPFEHARVKLKDKPEGSCDYVNASHLQASRSNKRYIATQGPLPATFEDFWSVIWEQDVRVVVMLTAETEGGQLKCHSYWKGRDFGAIRLKPLSEKKVSLDLDKYRSESHATPPSSGIGEHSRRRANTVTTLDPTTQSPKHTQSQGDPPFVIVRKFALSHASHPFAPIREITHLHFPSWPDFGTPARPSHLLALVELANVMQRSALPIETASVVGSKSSSIDPPSITWYDEPEVDARARPMLVHCSAGCGRTGTFCTVDSVIDMLKRQRQVKLKSTRTHDVEGDVQMGDAGDVSPRTNKEFNFHTRNKRPKSERRTSEGGQPIDTNWVRDDTLDLVQKTVEDFREQRLSMVQSLRQFVLCYETVLEWVSRMNDRGTSAPSGRARSGSLQQPRRDR